MNLILLLILVCAFSGCGWIQLFRPPDYGSFYKQMELRKQRENFFEKYMGFTEDEIINIFGEPKKIYKADPPKYNLPMLADEMWNYGYLAFTGAKSHQLLFKSGRLIGVNVF